MTAQLKDMILGALEEAGGVEYLKQQATENPVAFMTLLGKVLPIQVAASVLTQNEARRPMTFAEFYPTMAKELHGAAPADDSAVN